MESNPILLSEAKNHRANDIHYDSQLNKSVLKKCHCEMHVCENQALRAKS